MPRKLTPIRQFRIKAATLHNQRNMLALAKLIHHGDAEQEAARTRGDFDQAGAWAFCLAVADDWLNELEQEAWGRHDLDLRDQEIAAAVRNSDLRPRR